MLIVDMRRLLTFEPRQLAFETGLLQHAPVARRDRFGESVLAGLAVGIFEPPQRAITRQGGGDETRVALVLLPHGRIHGAEQGIGVDLDLVVLVALAFDASFPLLDLAWQPRHIEVMQGFEAQLHIGAGAHGVGRADQHAHPPLAKRRKDALLVGGLFVVLHERDLLGRHAKARSRLCLIQR